MADGRALVAIRAIQHGVHAEQREPVQVIFQLLCLHLPSRHGMALLAIRPELAAVQVGMAIRAARADIGEIQVGVALLAVHFDVHPQKRITRAIVVKFRDSPDGLPARVRMAVFAGDIDQAVRIPAGLLLRLDDARTAGHEEQDQERSLNELRRAHGTRAPTEFLQLGWGQDLKRLQLLAAPLNCTRGQTWYSMLPALIAAPST